MRVLGSAATVGVLSPISEATYLSNAMRERNNPDTVAEVMRRLHDGGAPCLLFGGWAEEAAGLCDPRAHDDIDLVLPAWSFQRLDRLLATGRNDLREVAPKRFAHKRAFLFHGILVETTLVQQSGGAAYTWFWGDVRFDWSVPLSETCLLGGHRLPVVTRENLRRCREHHTSTEPWRWRDPASLVSR